MLLVAEQDVVEKWTVTWQEAACNLKRDGVPELALLGLFVDFEIFELRNLVF
jgi:hypothetical protein